MFSKKNSLDLKDFDINRAKLDKNDKYLLHIFDKTKNQEVDLSIYLLTSYLKVLNDTKSFLQQPSIFNLKGTVKILGIQSPIKEDQIGEILNLFELRMPSYVDHYWLSALVSTEYMKYGLINDHIKNYIKTKGANHDIINPTVRSKIIYGVASIMNRLHKHHILQKSLLDSIYLDDNLEPKIKLLRDSFVIGEYLEIDKDDVLPSIKLISPEECYNDVISFPSDVFQFAFFLYAMFTGNFKFEYIHKCDSFKKLLRFISDGHRPELPKEIPKCYCELISSCWFDNPEDRPSFATIVDYLKDDKYALEEYGMKTDLNELHEYQKRIDNDKEEEKEETKTVELPIVTELKKKIKEYESVFLIDSEQNKKNEINFFDESDEENFTNLGSIGEGGTAVTYKIIDNRNKNQICKKVIKYKKGQSSIKDAQNVLKEFEVLNNLSHPCICKVYGINTQEKLEVFDKGKKKEMTTIALFLEYLEYNLDEVLKMKINNTMKTKIVVDIVHAMKYLHKNGIMHRDLKIENIMLNSIFDTKLVDFGLAKITEYAIDGFSFVGDSLTRGVGTLAYMSPEMINEEEYDFKTDVYSFGVVLHYMFIGSLPNLSFRDKLNRKNVSLPSPSASFSPLCIELISKCMSPNQSERPSFEVILNEMREKSYELADDVNPLIISKRDKELDLIEKIH